VHPHKPVRAGDDVIVQFEKDGECHAIIKQFVKFVDDVIVLEQHNPQQEITYQKSKVSALHTVVGTYVS
jgi:SOS-response transcriptional repressor LexA